MDVIRLIAVVTAYLTALGYTALGEYLFFFRMDGKLGAAEQAQHLPLLGIIIVSKMPPWLFFFLAAALVLLLVRHIHQSTSQNPELIVVNRLRPFRDDWISATLQIMFNRENRMQISAALKPAVMGCLLVFFIGSIVNAEFYARQMVQSNLEGRGLGFPSTVKVDDDLTFPVASVKSHDSQPTKLAVLWETDSEIDATPIQHAINGTSLNITIYHIQKATGKIFVQHRTMKLAAQNPLKTENNQMWLLLMACSLCTLSAFGVISTYRATKNTLANICIEREGTIREIQLPFRLAERMRDALLEKRAVLLRERGNREVTETLYRLGDLDTIRFATTENVAASPEWLRNARQTLSRTCSSIFSKKEPD